MNAFNNLLNRLLIINAFILLVTIQYSTKLSAQTETDLPPNNFSRIQDSTELADSIKFHLLFNIIKSEYLYRRPDSALILSTSLSDFAQEKNNQNWSAIASNQMGTSAYLKGDLPKAFQCFQRSLAFNNEEKNKQLLVQTLLNIGVIYDEVGQQDDALNFYDKAMNLAKEINYELAEANIYINSSIIFLHRKNYDKADEYLRKGLEIQKKIENNYGLSITYNNLAQVAFEQGFNDEALIYYGKCEEIQIKMADEVGMAYTRYNIGNIYKEVGLFEEAEENYQIGLDFHKVIGDSMGLSVGYSSLSELELKLNRYKEAANYAEMALELSLAAGAIDKMRNSAFALKNAYDSLGYDLESDSIKKLFNTLNDSILNSNKADSLNRLNIQAQIEGIKMATVKKGDSSKGTILLSVLIMILALMSIYVLKRVRKTS